METYLKHDGLQMVAYLAVAAGVKLVTAYRCNNGMKPRTRTRKKVGKVSGLTIYPIKSARSISVQEAECTRAGLKMIRPAGQLPVQDRFWMVTTASYEPITLMDYPKVALISVNVEDDSLVMTASNMEPFALPLSLPTAKMVDVSIQRDTVVGRDCGDVVAEWLYRVLGVGGCRLVWYPQDVAPIVRGKMQNVMSPEHGIAYAWSCPYMVIAEESLNDLNTRLAEPCSMETLRPNIIIEGAIPYEEEEWTKASIGPVTFEVAKLCERCRTINVDVDKGERYTKGTGPLDILRKYRPLRKETGYAPVLGIKYSVTNPGIIKIGDPIFVEE